MLGRRRVWLAAVAAAAVGWLGGAAARAGMIPPGGSVKVAAASSGAGSDVAGTVLRDELIPFTVRGAGGQSIFEGTLQDRVIRQDGGGTLVFAQTVRADRGFDRPVILDFLRRTGFAGQAAEADFTGGGDASPEKVFRSADGDLLHFKFDDKLFPGEATRLSFVRTESTAFDLGGDTELAFIAKGGVEGEVHLRTAQPAAGGGNPVAIPFPPAAAVFPLGAAAALWARRRFRRG